MKKHGVYKFKPYDVDRIVRDFVSSKSLKERIFDEYHSLKDDPRENRANQFFNEYIKRGEIVFFLNKDFYGETYSNTSCIVMCLDIARKKEQVLEIVNEVLSCNPQYDNISFITDKIKEKLSSEINIDMDTSEGYRTHGSTRIWSKRFTDADGIEVIDQWSKSNDSIWVSIIENPYLVCDESTGVPRKTIFQEFIPTEKSREFLESKGCEIVEDRTSISFPLEDKDFADKKVGEKYFGKGYVDLVLEQARKEFSAEKYQAFKKEFLSKDIYHKVFDHRGDVEAYKRSQRRDSKVSLNKYRDLFNSYGDFDEIEDESRFTKDVMPKSPSASF